MLIEFSVSNFRSINNRQSLSMLPGKAPEARHRYSHETGIKALPNVLRAAAILGPNGAGKSTLVEALEFMQGFVRNSAREGQEGDEIDVTPFLLGAETSSLESEFEVVFLLGETRYQYGFIVSEARVHAEWLYVVPKTGRMQRWFERAYDSNSGSGEWYINGVVKGERETWRRSTRDNALFLSTAVQLNSETLKPVFDWFRTKLRIVKSSQRLSDSYTAKQCSSSDSKSKILNLLGNVDTGITDLEVLEQEMSDDNIPASLPDEIKARLKGTTFYDVKAGRHVPGRGTVYLDLDTESDGTRVLFALAGPWLDVLENGLTLVVDELSNSLHPLAFRHLVSLINSSSNDSGAQLLFTTHDTTILTGKILHSDQVNLIEKNVKYESEIHPLSDFNVRSDEAMQKGYLGGRYGGLPLIDAELV